MAPTPQHYMRVTELQNIYRDIKVRDSLEQEVNDFWAVLLGEYFRQPINISRERQPNPRKSLEKCDIIVRITRHGKFRQVVIMENKRHEYESQASIWTQALTKLTLYLKLARDADKSKEVLYGAVNVGTYTRFYELHPNAEACIDYNSATGYRGQYLELRNDEAMIHYILLELVQKTRA